MLRNLLFKMRMSFRMWVRNRSRPVTIEEAEEKKLFWSKIYAACGAIIFLLVTSSTIKESFSNEFYENPPIRKMLEKLDDKTPIRVIKYSGFTKTSDALLSREEALKLSDSEMQTTEEVN